MIDDVTHALYTARMSLIVAYAVAVLALVVACSSLAVVIVKKKQTCDHAADVTTLKSQFRELDADIDDVFERLKRLTSRKGMQARREEVKSGAPMPGESAEAWKSRMRKARQNGTLQLEEV